MNDKDRDTLLRAVDRSLDPTVQLTDKLSITPNLPLSRPELNAPLDAVKDRVALTFKPDKTTTLKLERNGKSVGLKLTKKF